MNAASVLLDVALGDLAGIAGETLTFAGGSVTAVVSAVDFQDEYQMGGHNVKHGVTAAVRRSDLSLAGIPSPGIGDLFNYNGLTLQVIRVDYEASGLTLTASEVSV